jgi:hypothetical protein
VLLICTQSTLQDEDTELVQEDDEEFQAALLADAQTSLQAAAVDSDNVYSQDAAPSDSSNSVFDLLKSTSKVGTRRYCTTYLHVHDLVECVLYQH